MYKIIIIIIIIIGILISYNKTILSFLERNNSVIHVKDDNLNYKNSPTNREGKKFVGDNLKIYKITREKLLPLDNKNINYEKNNENLNINNNKDKIFDSIESGNEIISKNIYLQLASYKSKEKAVLFIKNFNIPSILDDNNLKLNIVSADIKDKGIYYRIRVGPYNKLSDVYQLCFDLNITNSECLIIKDK